MRTIDKTRHQIMKAAFEEFAEKGYGRTTTSQIAESAGVNEVTIFRQFGSKEQLFMQVIDMKMKEQMDLYIRRIEPTEDPVSDLVEMGMAFNEAIIANIPTMKLITKEYKNTHPSMMKVISDSYFNHVEVFSDYFQKAIEKGYIRKVNADLAGIMFFSYFYKLLIVYSFRKVRPQPNIGREQIEEYVKLFVYGLLREEQQ